VAVNHIWTRHFGQALVEPVTDFGRRAKRPKQQALLDWLAVRFRENGWRMKWLHRLIVTSRAYRLSGNVAWAPPTTRQSDPNNEFYWHRKPVRMESEVIRDSLLSLAGTLDLTIGGPSLDVDAKDVTFRRSLYFKHSRDDQDRFLTMFDDADIFQCYRREESVVPQQALALANSKLALEMSAHIANRLFLKLDAKKDPHPDDELVRTAFELILCRQPKPNEFDICRGALISWRELTSQSTDAGSETPSDTPREYILLVHFLINHNDFVTVR
jgi:hypothetical protein